MGTSVVPVIKLKTALIYGTSFVILANLIGFMLALYLNSGIPELAKAAPVPVNVSGVINSYLRVTAVNLGIRQFTADNLSGSISGFQAGKTIMIYQAKGANITTNNIASYGTVTAYNNAGNWEFAVVSSISGTGPYTITVSSLTNSYLATGAVQLVSVPDYTDALINGNVTATPWSASQGRGGIVALQVANELTLGADINVSGQGFTGGQTAGSNGDCPDNTTYRSNNNDFGAKGEGVSTDGRLYARAPQANAGGGGNPHNAGGGGGSNSTRGGYGGFGYQPGGCTNQNAGGIAGNKFDYASLSTKIFFGGGGGAGQQNDGLASGGAPGGGIIIVRAKTVKSSCTGTYGLISNGNSAANSGGNDGAGGGGGGGTIVLDVTSYDLTCPINVLTNGGNGGSVGHTAAHGGGGGGGVGITLQTSLTSNANVTIGSTPGTNGVDCSSGCVVPSGTLPETPAYYTMTIAGIPGQVITLPIELIAFKAEVVGPGVELLWVTGSEENNDYFTIERSSNGLEFKPFEEIEGAGNSKKILNYSIIDDEYFPGMTYYRLKQTDYDGKFSYSKVISVDTRSVVNQSSLYPNPASTVVHIRNAEDMPSTVRFLNSRGEVIHSEIMDNPVSKINVTDFEEGMYVVETKSDVNRKAYKLIIKH